MCLSAASWVFCSGAVWLAATWTYSPVKDLQKVHTECFIAEVLQKCSVNQHVSKFILLGISSLVTGFITSSTTDLQRWKFDNSSITIGNCLCWPSVVACKA